MKQTVYETGTHAEELLRKAINIWQLSDQEDSLTVLADDPVIKLLFTALAYKSEEMTSDIETLKQEVLDEYNHVMAPIEVSHAMPATAVVPVNPTDDLLSFPIDSRQSFHISGSADFHFSPLFKSTVYNIRIDSVTRLDGRRWSVKIHLPAPVSHLSGLTFVIKDCDYRDLNVTCKGRPLPLIKPWEYASMPLTDDFQYATMVYNKQISLRVPMLPLDLYARQNVRYYCLEDHAPGQILPEASDYINLIFDFTGITADTDFTANNVIFNAVLLANVEKRKVTLSNDMPLARVTGYRSSDAESEQFLHMLPPSDNQYFSHANIQVRNLRADRFNPGRLARMIDALVKHVTSDFYAFQSLPTKGIDSAAQLLVQAARLLRQTDNKSVAQSLAGVYLMLDRDPDTRRQPSMSVEVPYLVTNGKAANDVLKEDASFSVANSKLSVGKMLTEPVAGTDEIQSPAELAQMARYYYLTHDRIVTLADVKMFCHTMLIAHYNVENSIIRSITVRHREQPNPQGTGYSVRVCISMQDGSFVRRIFKEKHEMVATLLEKMLEVRSTGLYPYEVVFTFDN